MVYFSSLLFSHKSEMKCMYSFFWFDGGPIRLAFILLPSSHYVVSSSHRRCLFLENCILRFAIPIALKEVGIFGDRISRDTWKVCFLAKWSCVSSIVTTSHFPFGGSVCVCGAEFCTSVGQYWAFCRYLFLRIGRYISFLVNVRLSISRKILVFWNLFT